MIKEKIAIANWKMNLPVEGIEEWFEAMSVSSETTTVGVAPSFPFLGTTGALRGSLRIVAQNCAYEREGAFTGEVSAPMLASVGTDWVIVGHSERRNIFGESPATIGKKVSAVLAAGMVPILCIGEKEEVRESGDTDILLQEQLLAGLEGVDRSATLIVAYEPVWAIGTGRSATSAIVEETHAAVLEVLDREGFKDVPLLYGGSVTPTNALELSMVKGVNGFLVGGASLVSARFREIVGALDESGAANAKKG